MKQHSRPKKFEITKNTALKVNIFLKVITDTWGNIPDFVAILELLIDDVFNVLFG